MLLAASLVVLLALIVEQMRLQEELASNDARMVLLLNTLERQDRRAVALDGPLQRGVSVTILVPPSGPAWRARLSAWSTSRQVSTAFGTSALRWTTQWAGARATDIVASPSVRQWRIVPGQTITAKDLRTWAGTMLAARARCEAGARTTSAETKRRALPQSTRWWSWGTF